MIFELLKGAKIKQRVAQTGIEYRLKVTDFLQKLVVWSVTMIDTGDSFRVVVTERVDRAHDSILMDAVFMMADGENCLLTIEESGQPDTSFGIVDPIWPPLRQALIYVEQALVRRKAWHESQVKPALDSGGGVDMGIIKGDKTGIVYGTFGPDGSITDLRTMELTDK